VKKGVGDQLELVRVSGKRKKVYNDLGKKTWEAAKEGDEWGDSF